MGVVNTRPTSLGRIDPQAGLQATTGTLGYVTDFKPMTSQALTGPVAQAPSVESIPVVGQAAGLLSR